MPKATKRAVRHTSPLVNLAEDVSGIVDSLQEEMQSWYDNMPESFQSGDKGDEVQTCADELDSLKDACATLFDQIETLADDVKTVEVTYIQDERKSATSRSDRLGNAEVYDRCDP